MSTVPGAGVILTNDKQALSDLKLKKKTIDQLEKDKSLFFFSVNNSSNLISFISEADFTKGSKDVPKITIELIDPDHTFEDKFLRLPIKEAFFNRFDNIRNTSQKDSEYLEELKELIKELEFIETYGDTARAVEVLNYGKPKGSSLPSLETRKLQLKSLPSFRKELKDFELSTDPDTITAFTFSQFLEDLSKVTSRFYISYGVGDNLQTWAGPVTCTLFDASMEITANKERVITLEFIPMLGLLPTTSIKEADLKLHGYGMVSEVKGYSDPILGTSYTKVGKTYEGVEGESGGSYQRPELSKMVEIKSSLAEIFKSLKSIKRPNSLDSDNIEMFTPAAFQAKPSKGTLSHLIHTIDFHKIIVEAVNDYIVQLQFGLGSKEQVVILYPNLNELLYTEIRDVFLSQFSSIRNLVRLRKTNKELAPKLYKEQKQVKDYQLWIKRQHQQRGEFLGNGVVTWEYFKDLYEGTNVKLSELRKAEEKLKKNKDNIVESENKFISQDERVGEQIEDIIINFIERVLGKVGIGVEKVADNFRDDFPGIGTNQHEVSVGAMGVRDGEVVPITIQDKLKTDANSFRAVMAAKTQSSLIDPVAPNYFTPLENLNTVLSKYPGVSLKDFTDNVLYEDNTEVIEAWNGYSVNLNYDTNVPVAVFGYTPLIRKYLYGVRKNAQDKNNTLLTESIRALNPREKSVIEPNHKVVTDKVREIIEGPEGTYLKTDLANFYNVPDGTSQEFNLDDLEEFKKKSSKDHWPVFRVNTEDPNVLELDYTLSKFYFTALMQQGFSFNRRYDNLTSQTKKDIDSTLKLLGLDSTSTREEKLKKIKEHISNILGGADTNFRDDSTLRNAFDPRELKSLGLTQKDSWILDVIRNEIKPEVKEELILLLSNLGINATGPKIRVGKSSDITSLQSNILRRAIQEPVNLTIKTLPLFKLSSLYFMLSPALLVGKIPAIVGREKLVNDMLEIPGPDELSSFYSGKYLIMGWTHEISSDDVSSSFRLLNTVSNIAGVGK